MKLLKYRGEVPLRRHPHFAVIQIDGPVLNPTQTCFSCAFVCLGYVLVFGYKAIIWTTSPEAVH